MFTLRFAVVFGLAPLFHLCAASAVSPQEIVEDLQHSLSPGAEVVLTSNAQFAEEFTARFSHSNSPSFVVGAKPTCVDDVQKVVSQDRYQVA